ncbi:hypothetical protein [Streptomyces zaomyceticus]|uniref:hypothetical protein n=1 Tax=Streptomyces zaomyceticus TaxID=68286 RepID=UPI0019CC7368|nr:hypothetical protein [Streptomyces zaomyceticus]GHG03915.1 hypothetical protein GCM10018791_14850 [Streptomyces zaomyceticus]
MTPGRHTPDPREARTPAEFLALLQALKDRSGLTYRELSALAETRGEVLPRSTVANMLARATLPREELLTVFVRACGVAPGELAGWLEVRRELAGRGPYAPADPGDGDAARADPAEGDAADEDPAEAGAARPDPAGADRAGADPSDERPAAAEPSDASGTSGAAGPGLSWPVAPAAPSGGPSRPRSETSSRIRRAAVAAVAVTGLVLAGFSVVALLRDGRTGPAGQSHRTPAPATTAPATSGTAPTATAPAAGDVRIRVMGADLCLAERRGTRTGQIHQVPCAEAVVPLYSLAAVGAGRWRIVSDHPDFGPGCSGIPSGGRIPDAAYEDSECGDNSRIETFALEPYGPGGPVRGYRIVPVGSGTPGSCVTVVGDREAAWARLAQAPCVPDAAGQLFSFDRRGPASP